jgi:hypothetical protein
VGGEQKCDGRFGGLCCSGILLDVSGRPVGPHLKGSSNIKIIIFLTIREIRPAFMNAVMKLWVS